VKPIDFHLHRPETRAEALALLHEHADDVKVLAGGQSLVPLLNFRLARPGHLVDIGRIASLAGIRRTPAELVIGSMVRQAQAERSLAVAAAAPLLAAAFPNIAHPPIRNRGTVGGSLAHADPAAELPAVALALDAVFVTASVRGQRQIPASAFFRTHLTTALDADELLTEIRFPQAAPGTGAASAQFGRSLLDEVSASLIKEFAQRLEASITRDGAGTPVGAPPVSTEGDSLDVGRTVLLPLLRRRSPRR